MNPPTLDTDVRRVFDALRWIVRELRLTRTPGRPGDELSAAQAFVLHVLKENGALSINDLALRTATDPSSVSVVVHKLHQKGLVGKVASDEDRRRLRVTLTAPGDRATAASPLPVQQVLLERLGAMTPEELHTLAALMERVAPAVEDGRPAPMFLQDGAAGGRR
jgi:DNA-binding MarR family transcriptional regulator